MRLPRWLFAWIREQSYAYKTILSHTWFSPVTGTRIFRSFLFKNEVRDVNEVTDVITYLNRKIYRALGISFLRIWNAPVSGTRIFQGSLLVNGKSNWNAVTTIISYLNRTTFICVWNFSSAFLDFASVCLPSVLRVLLFKKKAWYAFAIITVIVYLDRRTMLYVWILGLVHLDSYLLIL